MNKVRTILRTTHKLRAKKSEGKFIYYDKQGNEGLVTYIPGKTKMLRKFARFCDNPHLMEQ